MILSRMGAQPRWIMLGIMISTALLSAFISNTATTAMMTPIVVSLCSELIADARAKASGAKDNVLPPVQLSLLDLTSAEAAMVRSLLLATCYAASIGGTLTLIGTGPNLVLTGLLNDAYPDNPVTFASWMGFSVLGMVINLILAWLLLQSLEAILNRINERGCCTSFRSFSKKGSEAHLSSSPTQSDLVPSTSDISGRDSAKKGSKKMAFVETELWALGSPSWAEGSVIGWFLVLLLMWITRRPVWNQWLPDCTDGTAAIAIALMLLVWPKQRPSLKSNPNINRNRSLVGSMELTQIKSDTHRTTGLVVPAAEGGIKTGFTDEPITNDLDISAIDDNRSNGYIVKSDPNQISNNSNSDKNVMKNSKNTVTNTMYDTILTWPIVASRMPWGIVFLLGGGFAVGKAVTESGLSKLVGGAIESLSVSPLVLSIATVILMTYMTEFTSNTATSNVLLPIILGVARAKCINPLYLGLPVTLAASFAFMLPVATPPNAIVFQAGDVLRVKDMIFAGLFMNIICMATVIGGTQLWGEAMFNLSSWPDWANQTCGALAMGGLNESSSVGLA